MRTKIRFHTPIALALMLCLAALSASAAEPLPEPVSDAAAESLGWQLGVHAFTFRNFTFFETVDKCAALGIRYIEVRRHQQISDDGDETMMYTMDQATRDKVRAKLDEAGVELAAYYGGSPEDEAEWRLMLGFAKDMGIGIITAEPQLEQLDLVERLADEYDIKIAIHNHAIPSRYWNPDTVLEALEGRSDRLGVCADTGHWKRSGLDPLEAVKKLEGRIISFHFKDLNKMESPDTPRNERTAHDVPWGTGVGNVFGVLEELKRQGFQGLFSVEYEHNWDHSLPEVAECARFFHLAAHALVEDGFRPLFRRDLSNAIVEREDAWTFEQGVLSPSGPGDIWSQRRYGNFVVDLEFRCADNTNSGVFLRAGDLDDWINTTIEIQILQPEARNDKHNCGGIFDCLAPSEIATRPVGEWNRFRIVAHDNLIMVVLNGTQVVHADLDEWTEAGRNPDGTRNKFRYAYKDMPRVGHLGLQYHGQPVWFRNVRVKPL